MLTRYYTLQEVAAAIKRSQRQVYRDIADGRLYAVKVQGQWRVSEDAYNNYVNGAHSSSIDQLLTSLTIARPSLSDNDIRRLMTAILAGEQS